jgi:hypothetical protein
MKLDIPALLRKPTAENRKPTVYGMYDQRYHNQIGGLTLDARIEVDAAATSWVVMTTGSRSAAASCACVSWLTSSRAARSFSS